MTVPAVEVEGLGHRYGDRQALDGVSFTVGHGELFALLGPNGGGKSTLFRILATLLPPSLGAARVQGHEVGREPHAVRHALGVVFQHPSLDDKLTVIENLLHHGHLYGLSGPALRSRCAALLGRFGLEERRAERVGRLSGGLQRRVELAKGMLPRPAVLLLDEPSTGLDPGARRDLGAHLRELREREGVTVVLTTHYMEEAERCDRIALLDRGRLVGLGTPETLRRQVGGDVVVVQATEPEQLRGRIEARLGLALQLVDGTLRIEHPRGHELVRDLVEAFPDEVQHVTYGKPTLEDVFVRLTGHRLFADTAEESG